MVILILILAAASFLAGVGVLALLMLVLAGIRTEERCMSLISTSPSRVSALSRRILGVYVRQPRTAPRCRYQDARR
ncbi:MAG: hypothetical protein ACRDNF_22375 [Streptosporangiaceae bacterium]